MCCLPERNGKHPKQTKNQIGKKTNLKICFWFVFLLPVQIRESFSRETRYLFYTPHSTRAFLFDKTYTHKHFLKKNTHNVNGMRSEEREFEIGSHKQQSFSQGKMSAPSAISPISCLRILDPKETDDYCQTVQLITE